MESWDDEIIKFISTIIFSNKKLSTNPQAPRATSHAGRAKTSTFNKKSIQTNPHDDESPRHSVGIR
jgi:hypothetical protein